MKMKNRILLAEKLILGIFLATFIGCSSNDEETLIKQESIITWGNPEDMYSGLALSDTELNATANVPGAFVYTPAIGTVLSLGANQNLKIDFTPTDAVNYNTATKTVTINVVNATDFDGNVYKVVAIGNQIWMAENLKATHYRNGDLIPNITDNTEWGNLTTGAWSFYANSDANGNLYGRQYNFYAVVDPRGLAPEGWHVASNAEWTALNTFLGGDDVAAPKLKATSGWPFSTFTTPNNESGFSALPGGARDTNGIPYWIDFAAFWWTSTDIPNSADANMITVYKNESYIDFSSDRKDEGYSVRCIKN
jgi:uncharacterized protein (TIGR02145 family)